MDLGKLGILKMSEIEIGERHRKDYGEMDELIFSISERGLICPIAVVEKPNNPKPYLLAAGGRRMLAFHMMQESEIPCRIFDHDLTELEVRSIELAENIHRKDLDHMEKCMLMKEIDDLQKEIHGEKVSTADDATGHSLRDTARLVGKSIGTVSEYVRIAQAHAAMPELELDKCKTMDEAKKKLKTVETMIVRSELARRAEKELGDTYLKLADNYIIGDFYDGVRKLQEGVIDLVEIDPPYAIDLPAVKKSTLGYDASYGDSYNEISKNAYAGFMQQVLKECYRVMNNHSWLLVWYAIEPWAEQMYQWIIDAGFETRRMPAMWCKPAGQTHQPQIYLASDTEYFFYARKGGATIAKPGRSSRFEFNPVPSGQKIHPTERPEELMREILTTFTWEGSRVLVPFAGSGVTLLSAYKEKMFPIGFELSKVYKDAFVSRLYEKKGGE
uniref:Putative methyltransferase n=1 Tax=viral metagenome TaxID=1070528 RepID=A0A6M3K8S9_9ZZZZ